MTIVVVGDVMEDVVAALPGPLAHGSDTPARITRHPGGSGANVAGWLRAVAEEAVLVACVGADSAEEGPAIQRDPHLPTGACIVLVDPAGERTMIPDAGANDALLIDDLPPGRHLHVTGYGLLRERTRDEYLRALEIARARGMTISVDPSSAAPLAAAPDFLSWVEGVDLLLPNADEVRVLGGADDVERAALALGREVVVTLGADGALWTDGERVLRAGAEAVDVVDTTGAGDAFAAGLLAARANGADPAAQLAGGCLLAARAVAMRGGRPVPPAGPPRYD